MFSRRHFLGVPAAMAMLGSRPAALAADKPMRLGTLPVVSTRTAYEIYHPLLAHLEKAFNQSVILETPPNFKAMYQRVQENGFDLLVSPPHIARLAQKKLGWHPLVMCQPEHHSVLLAMEANGPANLEALRGGTLAVLDNSALVAMIMMDALSKRGLMMDRDFKVIETRSYESSQIAVKQGVAQAMISRSQGFIDPNARDRMKVLFEAGALPGYVFIAAPATSKDQLQNLRSELLTFGAAPAARPFLEKLGYDSVAVATEDAMRRLDPYLATTESKLK
ncbi:MAG: PhnD/SsuA/transferrin family substrate-binding protein [Comamonadaceae bacterium]|nr:PhnD/SsuA/transferrin family substrate-binding protein [Comamonadaceae bacterium]